MASRGVYVVSIRVDLVWRIFAAARSHRFSQLADAIDTLSLAGIVRI